MCVLYAMCCAEGCEVCNVCGCGLRVCFGCVAFRGMVWGGVVCGGVWCVVYDKARGVRGEMCGVGMWRVECSVVGRLPWLEGDGWHIAQAHIRIWGMGSESSFGRVEEGISRTDVLPGKVHSGFFESAKSINRRLKELLVAACSNNPGEWEVGASFDPFSSSNKSVLPHPPAAPPQPPVRC